MTRKEALEIRKIIEKASCALGDSDAASAPLLFPRWKAGEEYEVGNRVCHEGRLYKCLAEHTSQSDWQPNLAVSLFERVADPAAEYPEWIRPAGAHDAYNEGDKVSYAGKEYVSEIPANVYEPGVYGWKEVRDE